MNWRPGRRSWNGCGPTWLARSRNRSRSAWRPKSYGPGLCGTMAPAALTQSLAQIRLQLAEEHRLTRADLAGQKAEVQALSARLAEQHRKLAQQRDDLQSWATERQKELEKQAGLLVTAERQMDEERAGFKEETQAWQNERFRLQQEIRRLLRQLNRAEAGRRVETSASSSPAHSALARAD